MNSSSPITTGEKSRSHGKNWGALILGWIIALAVAAVVVLILAQTVPAEWARLISSLTNSEQGTSVALGLLSGAVLTWLSLSILWQMRRPVRASWRVIFVVLAVIVTLPNLLTMAVVAGTFEEASRELRERAPGFSDWMFYGIVVGAVIFFITAIASIVSRRRKKKLKHFEQAQAMDERAAKPEPRNLSTPDSAASKPTQDPRFGLSKEDKNS